MDEPLSSLPPPPGWQSYWPYVLFTLAVLPASVRALWDGWRELRGKKIEVEAAAAARRDEAATSKETREIEVKVESLKLDLERQKDFQDDLMAECKAMRDECGKLRDANHVLTGTVMGRDAIIRERDQRVSEQDRKMLEQEQKLAERDRQIGEMQKEIDGLKRDLALVKEHVKSLEATRQQANKSVEESRE